MRQRHFRGIILGLGVCCFLAVVVQASENENDPKQQPLTDAEKKTIEQIREQGGTARELAQNDNRLVVTFHLSDKQITDESLAALKDLQRTVELNLRGTEITDAGLAHLAGLTELERLHLEKTKITDAGLAHLKGLQNLQYLNLYGTQVTDAGLEHLKGLKALKKIYLWESKATNEGVAGLQQALPEAEIVREFVPAKPWPEEPAVAPKPEKA